MSGDIEVVEKVQVILANNQAMENLKLYQQISKRDDIMRNTIVLEMPYEESVKH